MNLFLGHMLLLVCTHKYFFRFPYNFTFISWLSLPPEKEMNSCPHSVRYAKTVPLKLYSDRQLVLTKKQKQSRVFPLAAASTHTLTRLLNLNLDCPFFVFSLCVQVPLGLRPK